MNFAFLGDRKLKALWKMEIVRKMRFYGSGTHLLLVYTNYPWMQQEEPYFSFNYNSLGLIGLPSTNYYGHIKDTKRTRGRLDRKQADYQCHRPTP